MIKKKSVAALAAAMTMTITAGLGCTAYADVTASGVTALTSETSSGTGSAVAESSSGIVEANAVLDPSGALSSAVMETTAAVVQTSQTSQTNQIAKAMQTAQASQPTGGLSAGPTGTAASIGPTVPGSTSSTDTTGTAGSTALSGLFNTGTSSDGASTALNTLSSIPLPGNFYFSNTGAYTYQNMVADLNALQAAFPSMQMSVLANTVDGRQIYHVVVGNPQAPHQILVHAGIHAREYIVSQLAMREIASLLVMQQGNLLYQGQSVAALLQNTCIHFVPMVNPDGITLVQGGIDALNTEAAKAQVQSIIAADGATNVSSYLRQWKNNINGVNLNRNFDAYWQEATPKVNHPSNMNYKGTAAECEIESKALADLCRQIMPDYTISYHTQGRVIYWYFGETGTYKAKAQYLANVVHQNSGYEISNTWSQTDAAGFKDWAELKLDIPSVTIECGHGTSPVSESQISQIWEENDGILPDLLVGLGA